MIAQRTIRRAALAASVMDSRSRTQLLNSLEAEVADRLMAAMRDVQRFGWDRRDLVGQYLAVAMDQTSSTLAMDASDLCRLAVRMDSAGFSRLLAAQGGCGQEFLLATLDPDFAEEVRRHLSMMPTLPPRLRVATLEAAAKMTESQYEEIR